MIDFQLRLLSKFFGPVLGGREVFDLWASSVFLLWLELWALVLMAPIICSMIKMAWEYTFDIEAPSTKNWCHSIFIPKRHDCDFGLVWVLISIGTILPLIVIQLLYRHFHFCLILVIIVVMCRVVRYTIRLNKKVALHVKTKDAHK